MSSLNDQVIAWLASQNKTPAPSDYQTAIITATGVDTIAHWNTTNLGTQPTLAQLAAVVILTPVPQSVSQRQARLALNQQGLLTTVQAAINSADQPTQIAWAYASQIDRNDPLVTTLGAALSLTSTQIDNLFTLAATL